MERLQNLKVLVSEEEIHNKIIEMAKKLDLDYAGKEITFVMILKGAICVTADLIRELKIPNTIDSIRCSSYREGEKKGALTILGVEKLDIKDKHVIVIDDIFDTGATMNGVINILKQKNPASIKSLVLLLKKNPRREKEAGLPDYSMFEIEDKFVVGYGLDYDEYYRGLKTISYFTKN
ncbi:MAG: hypoxanthine phosphoribosyltransferase [Chlamydiae bacterium]|nr:hypoxanthine phosphoribosyltransferase [Chlamydiota bacterium]